MQFLVFSCIWRSLYCRVPLIEPADLEVLLHPPDVDVDPLVHRAHARGEEPPVAGLGPARPRPPLAAGPLLPPDRGHAASGGHQRPATVPESPGGQGQRPQTDGVKIPAQEENDLNREAAQRHD